MEKKNSKLNVTFFGNRYRYMYLKRYAKFTFCIESQGHVSDENFLYYCMHLASKILPTVSEIYKPTRLTSIYY